ncbi:MAG: hypothetical protein DBY17_08685 [Oscillospiraceae bacterium]|nr:MAG: hypothetical protein DBY17_08685 [Oscillospiraceae bacterium]
MCREWPRFDNGACGRYNKNNMQKRRLFSLPRAGKRKEAPLFSSPRGEEKASVWPPGRLLAHI